MMLIKEEGSFSEEKGEQKDVVYSSTEQGL